MTKQTDGAAGDVKKSAAAEAPEQMSDEYVTLLQRTDMAVRGLRYLCVLVSKGEFEKAGEFVEWIERGGHTKFVTLLTKGEKILATGWLVGLFMVAMRDHLDAVGAPNFTLWGLTFEDGRSVDLIAQWADGVLLKDRHKAMTAVIAAVRAERAAREAWLASLPEGSCGNPPTQELLDAEATTGALLAALDAQKGGAR